MKRLLLWLIAVGREQKIVVGGRSPLEDHIARAVGDGQRADRKSTRLNSSH